MYLPKVGSYSVCSTILYCAVPAVYNSVRLGQVRLGQVHVSSTS